MRAITDPLDAVGNTTKAVTKGYAIGSAGSLRSSSSTSYTSRASTAALVDARTSTCTNAWVIAGLFIGGLMPFLFASLAMQAVGRVGGQVVRRCGASSARSRGSWRAPSGRTTARAIDIVTGSAIKR